MEAGNTKYFIPVTICSLIEYSQIYAEQSSEKEKEVETAET